MNDVTARSALKDLTLGNLAFKHKKAAAPMKGLPFRVLRGSRGSKSRQTSMASFGVFPHPRTEMMLLNLSLNGEIFCFPIQMLLL